MDHLLSNQLATDLPLRRPLSSDAVSGTAARRMRLSEDMASRFSFAQLLGQSGSVIEVLEPLLTSSLLGANLFRYEG
jgi:hypothetical protein